MTRPEKHSTESAQRNQFIHVAFDISTDVLLRTRSRFADSGSQGGGGCDVFHEVVRKIYIFLDVNSPLHRILQYDSVGFIWFFLENCSIADDLSTIQQQKPHEKTFRDA